MNIKLPKQLDRPDENTKKNLMKINLFFFIVHLFITFVNLQFLSLVPSWISCCFIIGSVCNIMIFIYGFRLRTRYKLKSNLLFFAAAYMLLISIQTFLTSNIGYFVDLNAGRLTMNVDYISFSTTLYIIMVLVVSFILYSLSSSKVLLLKINTPTMYYVVRICGILLIFLTVYLMLIIGFIYLKDDYIVFKDMYKVYIASVMLGYLAVFLILLGMKYKK